MKRTLLILISITFLFLGCKTTNKSVLTDQELRQKEREIFSEIAEGYLVGKNYPALTYHLNSHRLDMPNECAYFEQLLATKLDNEFLERLDKKDYLKSYALFRSLKAFDKAAPVYEAMLQGLKPEWNNSGAEIPASIQDYVNLIGSIEIEREYFNDDNFTRKDYPLFCGSGFFLSNEYVLTAYHVVEKVLYENTTNASISFIDSSDVKHSVRLYAWDEHNDIALLKLRKPTKNVPNVYSLLADNDDLNFGTRVFVIGNPLNYNTSVTQGIVSNPNRNLTNLNDFLQVDASVAPGSSGGLVINENYKVAGIVSAGVRTEEINFVIPSTLIKKSLEYLVYRQNVRIPWLGIFTDSELRIRAITPSSPLNTLELEKYKVSAINNKTVSNRNEMLGELLQYMAGDIVKVTFTNEDKTITHLVHLSSRPDRTLVDAFGLLDQMDVLKVYYGINLEPKVSFTNQYMQGKTRFKVQFHKVLSIEEDSDLYLLGVRALDSLGIVGEYNYTFDNYLEVLHLPHKSRLDEINDINDYFYYLEGVKNEENLF